MTSMLDIVAEATSAATKGWKRARQAAFGSATGGAASRAPDPDQLARLIKADILPRLMASHGQPLSALRPVPDGLVPQLARALLEEDLAPLLDRVEALQASGFDPLALMEDVLAPAVRLLGEWWIADDIDFVDVTMASWRCQQLVHALAAGGPGLAPLPGNARRALLVPAPGEQHVLGAMMVEDAFRRAGWATQGGAALDEDGLVALVARERFDVVGLSVSSERLLEPLPRTIAAMRRAARRPVLVLLGGPAVADKTDMATTLGADAVAATAAAAVRLAESLPARAG